MNQFYTNPKKECHRKCAIKIIALILEFQDINEFNLFDIYNKVAPTVNLKTGNAVNSLMTRYLNEMFTKTDDDILKQMFKTCHDSTAPTAKEFFIIVTKKIRNKL